MRTRALPTDLAPYVRVSRNDSIDGLRKRSEALTLARSADWPPSLRSRRVAKQRELAKRVVAKQLSAKQTRSAQRSNRPRSLC